VRRRRRGTLGRASCREEEEGDESHDRVHITHSFHGVQWRMLHSVDAWLPIMMWRMMVSTNHALAFQKG
jgi:hypothetical protein